MLETKKILYAFLTVVIFMGINTVNASAGHKQVIDSDLMHKARHIAREQVRLNFEKICESGYEDFQNPELTQKEKRERAAICDLESYEHEFSALFNKAILQFLKNEIDPKFKGVVGLFEGLKKKLVAKGITWETLVVEPPRSVDVGGDTSDAEGYESFGSNTQW